MKQLSAYRRLFGLLPGHRRLVIAFVVMALLASAAEGLGVGLVIPSLEGWRGDASHWAHKIPLLGVFGSFFHALSLADRVRLVAVVLFFIVLVQSGLRYVERLVALQLHVRIERALKREAILQLYRVSLQFIQRKSAGDLLTVLVMHTRQAANVVTVLASIVANASILFVYAALMLVLSWQLTLVAAGLLVPLALLNQRLSADQLRKEGEAQNIQQRKVRKVMIESLSLMKLSHLYAQEHRSIERADQVFD
ncbi:MAG: ABC transporter transmembrane domain-containing protein, partial [Planctomycetota bacterium]|nr:ABC transporter transmembrane domain-containing protein [Planctomycetota bacterium]